MRLWICRLRRSSGSQSVSFAKRMLVVHVHQARSTTLKDHLAGIGVSAVSGLTTALAGGPWWAVLVAVLAVLGMTYGMVLWLAHPKRSQHVSCFLITWEAPVGPEESPIKAVQADACMQSEAGQASRTPVL
jgi:cell division protein FtsW (lipid II flippase)